MNKKIIVVISIIISIYCASTNQFNSISDIDFGLEPIFTVAVLSLSYFEIENDWPMEIDSLAIVTSPDYIETLKSKFTTIQFKSHGHGNFQMYFSLKPVENDSVLIKHMKGNLEITSSEIANVDSLKVNSDLEIHKMSISYLNKSTKSLK